MSTTVSTYNLSIPTYTCKDLSLSFYLDTFQTLVLRTVGRQIKDRNKKKTNPKNLHLLSLSVHAFKEILVLLLPREGHPLHR